MLNKIILILVGLSLTGCGQECNEEFFTGSINVCSKLEDTPDNFSELAEKTIEITEKEVQRYYPNVTELSETLNDHNVSVILTDKYLVKRCKPIDIINEYYECEDILGGYNIRGTQIVMVYSFCPNMTILSHEILHSVEWFYFNDGIREEHSLAHFFNKPFKIGSEERETTIETRSNAEIRKYCMEISKWNDG